MIAGCALLASALLSATRLTLRGGGRRFGRDPQDARRQADIHVLLDLHWRLLGLLRLLLGLLLGLMLRLRVLLRLLVLRLVLGLLIIAAVVALPLIVAVITVIAALVTVVAALVGALLAVILRVLTVLLLLEARIQNPVVMVGMLKVIFSQHTVAGGTGVARHGQELFHELLGITPYAPVVIPIKAAVWAPAAAAAWTRLAVVTATLTIFHIFVMLLIVHQNEVTF